MRALRPTLVLAVAALAGCALKSPPERAELAKQALPNLEVPERWAEPAGIAGAVGNGWLAEFNDPQLDALVQEALANNPDLQVAAARVEQAAAFVKVAGATLYPQVNALARGGGALSGDSSGLEGAGVFANWELDLWGRVRAGREAAQRPVRAPPRSTPSTRASRSPRWSPRAGSSPPRRGCRRRTPKRWPPPPSASSASRRTGCASARGDEYDVALARANLATFRDSVRSLELAYQQALRALEALAGRYPAAALSVPAQLAALPGPVPVGMPSELLERRPDVVAAERRVAAAFYRVEEAKAARLPRISLTAAVTSISSELFVLKERDNPVWSAGASLTAPLYLGGQLQAQVEVRTAEQKQALAEYGRVGARAFGEVENALSTGFALEEREAILSAVGRRQRARARARERALPRRARATCARCSSRASRCTPRAPRCCACRPSAWCSA